MTDLSDSDIFGGIVLDESLGQQNGGDTVTQSGVTLEDDNDNDISVNELPPVFANWMAAYLSVNVADLDDEIHEAALSNYGTVTGTVDLTNLSDGDTVLINNVAVTYDASALDPYADLIAQFGSLSGINAELNADNQIVLYTTGNLSISGDTEAFGLPALLNVAADSFELTKVFSLTGDDLDYIALTTGTGGLPFPVLGVDADGVPSGLWTSGNTDEDRNPIHLWLVPDPTNDGVDDYILIGFEVDADGDPIDPTSPAIAIYFEQVLTPGATDSDPDTLEGRFWTVQFDGVSIDNANSENLVGPDGPDNLVTILDEAISLTITNELSFDATNAPSGQNMFIMFASTGSVATDEDGDGVLRHDYAIVATGRDPADVDSGENLTSGDTVNSSKAKGQDQVFGTNNQMLTADTDGDGLGDTLVLTFVTGARADYTVPELDQNEADDEHKIDFEDTLGATSAQFDVVQLQSGKSAVLYLTALSENISGSDTIDGSTTGLLGGSTFEEDLETQLGNMDSVAGIMVGFESITVVGARAKGKNAPDVTFTVSYAEYAAYVGADDAGSDLLDFGDPMTVLGSDGSSTITVAFNEDGMGVQMGGILAGDTVKYTTDDYHVRLLIENDGDNSGDDSAEFDVGNFMITQVSTQSVAIGDIFGFEDDYPFEAESAPKYVEEEDSLLGGAGNEDETTSVQVDLADVDTDVVADNDFDNITNGVSVDAPTILQVVSGTDADAVFSLDLTGATLPVRYSRDALIDYHRVVNDDGGSPTPTITGYVIYGTVVSIEGTKTPSTDIDPGASLVSTSFTIDELDDDSEAFSFNVPTDGETVEQLVTAINASGFLTAELDGDTLRIESVDHANLDFSGFEEFGITDGAYGDYADDDADPLTTRSLDNAVTFEVTPAGLLTFTVLRQIDHDGAQFGDNLEADIAFDFTSALHVVDSDGDPVLDLGDLADFRVLDDVPITVAGYSSGVVEDEHFNPDATDDPGTDDVGPDPKDGDVEGNLGITTNTASGSLAGLVSVGTDENLGGGAAFSLTSSGLGDLPDLFSGGEAVVYDLDTTNNILYGYIERGDPGADSN
ncbi:hypothetical protein, partial [Silicimonas sp. MF1-12-2]|uniref:hypothetical protein n=1 Tax=Silicimonas sp. MF1-12-2 TaxID=3384793 RepID=UPI0039B52A00